MCETTCRRSAYGRWQRDPGTRPAFLIFFGRDGNVSIFSVGSERLSHNFYSIIDFKSRTRPPATLEIPPLKTPDLTHKETSKQTSPSHYQPTQLGPTASCAMRPTALRKCWSKVSTKVLGRAIAKPSDNLFYCTPNPWKNIEKSVV